MVLTVVVLSEDIRVTIGDNDYWLKVDKYRFWQREEIAEWLRELLAYAHDAGVQRTREETDLL